MLLVRECPALQPIGKSGLKPFASPSPAQRLRAAPFRPVKHERRHAKHCRAEDGRNSRVTDIRKIDTEKGGLAHTLRETVITPETVVPVALGVGGAFLAGYGQDGAVLGEIAGNSKHSRLSEYSSVIRMHLWLQAQLLVQFCELLSYFSFNKQSLSRIESTPCSCLLVLSYSWGMPHSSSRLEVMRKLASC